MLERRTEQICYEKIISDIGYSRKEKSIWTIQKFQFLNWKRNW